jgi:hypothetical protein
MTHSAYLLSTVMLAAAAAIHLQDMRSGTDRPDFNTAPNVVHSALSTPSFASPPAIQTIGTGEVRTVQQPQRWVF